VLLGLEVLVLKINPGFWKAVVVIIPIVLLARFVSVWFPAMLMRKKSQSASGLVLIMTWGGLRGGISVALALSLPPGTEREFVLAITYAVVVFSIIVQGLTVPKLVKQVLKTGDSQQRH
jgi:CPA1 family monovalent cation:H+ antiporter